MENQNLQDSKYLDLEGLRKYDAALKSKIPTKMSDLEQDIEIGTGSGKIDSISVNNVEQTITDKTVNITIPTKVSDLTNDSNYLSKNENITNTEINNIFNTSSSQEEKYLSFEGLKKYDQKIKQEIETLISFDEDSMIIGGAGNDGELSGETNQIKSLYTFNNVNELKESSNLKEGDIVDTLGYYQKGDGGNAFYYISTGTTSIITEIQLNDNKIAKTINKDNIYNVLQYGIKRNSSEDVSDKVNELLLQTNHDAIVFFPPGVYKFNKKLFVKRVTTFRGEISTLYKTNWDQGGTYFDVDCSNLQNECFIDMTESSNAQRGNFENIIFKGNSYNMTDDRLKYANDIEYVYEKTTIYENVDCLRLGYDNSVTNCAFIGWSGVACTGAFGHSTENGSWVSGSAWQNIQGCFFEKCKVGIETTIDSQYSDLRLNLIDTGIIVNGTANILTNIRMDSVGGYGIYFNDNSHENIVSNLNIDVGYYAGVVLHGRNNEIKGRIGRVGTRYAGVPFSEIPQSEYSKCCALYMKDNGTESTNYNDISLIIYQTDAAEYINEIKLSPAIPIVFGEGSYLHNNINLITNFSDPYTNQSVLNNIVSYDSNDAYFSGVITINGDRYDFVDKSRLPFDVNIVYKNKYLIGTSRDPATRPPQGAGQFIGHYWLDKYCMSYYNPQTEKFEWKEIGNPKFDTTLTKTGQIPDAKVVGDAISSIRTIIDKPTNILTSPNGTEFRLSISNEGQLIITKISDEDLSIENLTWENGYVDASTGEVIISEGNAIYTSTLIPKSKFTQIKMLPESGYKVNYAYYSNGVIVSRSSWTDDSTGMITINNTNDVKLMIRLTATGNPISAKEVLQHINIQLLK